MPIPNDLNDTSHLHVGTYNISIDPAGAVTRPGKEVRQFHAYLELYFQGKHDSEVRSFCDQHRIDRRNRDGTQVEYGRGQTMADFYSECGRTICERVSRHIKNEWEAAPGVNNGTFVRGQKNIMAIQGERQSDYQSYDVNFYYCGSDVYVAFHCYPSRN